MENGMEWGRNIILKEKCNIQMNFKMENLMENVKNILKMAK